MTPLSADADRSGIGRGSPGGADGLPARVSPLRPIRFQLAKSAAATKPAAVT